MSINFDLLEQKREYLNSTVITPSQDNQNLLTVYNYPKYTKDNIFYSRISEELTKEILSHSQKIRREATQEQLEHQKCILAGDLSEEYGLLFHDNMQLWEKLNKLFCQCVSNALGFDIISLDIQRVWTNFQKPNETNPIHNHVGTISLVWYLDVPEEIRQEHKKQRSNSVTRGLISFHSSFIGGHNLIFNPQTCDMLMFDSSHFHQVYPFHSNNERITLSANLENLTYFNGIGELTKI